MKQRLCLLLVLLVCVLGCDSSNPVAPAGTVLTIVANPTQISLTGSATITVTGFRPDGNPLNPGTQIILSLSGQSTGGGGGGGVTTSAASDSLGVIQPTIVEIGSDGRATATFTADGRPGTATVTATTTTGDASATVDVQIGETDATKPTLSITASPDAIDLGESSTISVLARQPDSTPLPQARVRLQTTLGTLDEETLTTDANGEASTTLRSGDQPGTATITGTVGTSDEVSVSVEIRPDAPTLFLAASPSTIQANTVNEDTGALEVTPNGESLITIVARDSNSLPLGADERIVLTSDLGTVTRNSSVGDDEGPIGIDEVFTDANGEARVYFAAGTRSGTGGVTAILRNSSPGTVSITIEVAPASFTFQATPRFVPNTGGSVALSATVVDAEGRPASGILVRFDSSAGGTFNPGTAVTTDSRGLAETTVTYTESDLSGLTTVNVEATVRIGGEDQTKTIEIEVR